MDYRLKIDAKYDACAFFHTNEWKTMEKCIEKYFNLNKEPWKKKNMKISSTCD